MLAPVMTVSTVAQHQQGDHKSGGIEMAQQQDSQSNKATTRISFSVAALLADTRPNTRRVTTPEPRQPASSCSPPISSDDEDDEDVVSVLGTPPSSPRSPAEEDERPRTSSPEQVTHSPSATPHALAGIMAHVVAPVRPTPFSLAAAYSQHPGAWPSALAHHHHHPFAPFGTPGSPFGSALSAASGKSIKISINLTKLKSKHYDHSCGFSDYS